MRRLGRYLSLNFNETCKMSSQLNVKDLRDIFRFNGKEN